MKNNQKGFIVPILIAVIALLVIGGGVYIYNNKKAKTPSVIDNGTQPTNTQTNNSNSQTNTSNWKTYSDSVFRLQINYPPTWTRTSDAENDPRYNVAFYFRKNQSNSYEETNSSVHISGNEDCGSLDTKGWKTDSTLKYVKRVCYVEKRLLITLIAPDESTKTIEDAMIESIKFTN